MSIVFCPPTLHPHEEPGSTFHEEAELFLVLDRDKGELQQQAGLIILHMV